MFINENLLLTFLILSSLGIIYFLQLCYRLGKRLGDLIFNQYEKLLEESSNDQSNH